MNYNTLKSKKKITLATLKSFINGSNELYVKHHSSFNGMTDMVENIESELIAIDKENAISHKGVWCVGKSDDRFTFSETLTMYGINVYNCVGSSTIYTNK